MRQKTTQQIKVYKQDVSQTERNGAFYCPNCGTKISPDDHSEANYSILDSKVKANELDEIIIQCNICRSLIHLGNFSNITVK
jgi:predicted RNA-binding Zn-ribbon protein involved in translation (DUF1610 family)